MMHSGHEGGHSEERYGWTVLPLLLNWMACKIEFVDCQFAYVAHAWARSAPFLLTP